MLGLKDNIKRGQNKSTEKLELELNYADQNVISVENIEKSVENESKVTKRKNSSKITKTPTI